MDESAIVTSNLNELNSPMYLSIYEKEKKIKN